MKKRTDMYDIWIPSSRPELAEETKKCFPLFNAVIFDGSGYGSFSKLINDCILSSTNEIIIIIADKVRGNSEDIVRMLKLINEGYGIVCLSIFYFFGFKKDLIRKIGWLDERYVLGGWEDADYLRRLKEANIGFYYEKEVPVIEIKTSWGYCKPGGLETDINSLAGRHYLSKWAEVPNKSFTRLMEEEMYPYDIGDYNGSVFVDFSKTVYHKKFPQSFLTMEIH
jgi:hypothetical protein